MLVDVQASSALALDRTQPPLSPTIKLMPQPRDLTAAEEWATMERETLEGISYAAWKWPAEGTIRAPMFAREPVDVEDGDKMLVLDRLEDHNACRVRVLRTGLVGLVPMWTMEDPFERMTRINTDLNEIKTCPSERKHPGQHVHDEHSTSPHRHDHNRCVVEPRDRIRRRLIKVDEDTSDSDSPASPASPTRLSDKLPRKVGFAESNKKKVYRYVPPTAVLAEDKPAKQDPSMPDAASEPVPNKETEDEPMDVDDEQDDPKTEESHEAVEGEWWWSGWEEEQELPPQEVPTTTIDGDDDDDRIGRPRFRRHTFSVDSSSAPSFSLLPQPTSFQV